MHSRIESLQLLCDCLGPGLQSERVSDIEHRLSSERTDWMEVIRIANHHALGPALWSALSRKALTAFPPEDVREVLGEFHRLNVVRNARLRTQAEALIADFNGATIEPVFLKGGALLFEPAFGDPGARLMRDLDVLVPKDRFEDAIAIATERGYRPIGDLEGWHYQFPPMFKEGEVACVEIHRDIGPQRVVLDTETASACATRLAVDGLRAFALSPTHRVTHSLFHGEIQNRHHELGIVSLKSLHDLLALDDRHGRAIDWDEVYRRMAGQQLGHVADAHLYVANRLFGFPFPANRRPTRRARAHFARCLARVRWTALARATNLWASVTHPFTTSTIRYLYGDGGAFHLTLCRLRVAARLARKHGRRLPSVARDRRDLFYGVE